MQGTAQGAGGGVRGERCGWGRGSRCVCVPVACVWGGASTTGRRPVQRCWGGGGARPGEGCVLRRSLWGCNTHICDGHSTRAPHIRAPAASIPQTNCKRVNFSRVPPLARPEFFTRTTGTARPGRASGHSGRPAAWGWRGLPLPLAQYRSRSRSRSQSQSQSRSRATVPR